MRWKLSEWIEPDWGPGWILVHLIGLMCWALLGLLLNLVGVPLMRFFDVSSAVLITLCIWNCQKAKWIWLVYAYATVPFVIIQLILGAPGYALMGLLLIISGLRNWWRFDGIPNKG